MQSPLLAISGWFYHALLQIYPADFRKRFAAEMTQVFRSLCDSAYRQSGARGVMRLWLPAFWDWAWAACYQWWLRLFKGRMVSMQSKPINPGNGIPPLSAAQAGLAALPFLAFGISSLVSQLQFFRTYPVGLPLWKTLLLNPFLAFNWLILIGLGAGILAGFPRWAYPFLGWAILFAAWWADVGFYGYFLGWKIWLPLLGMLLITLLIRRSLAPLRNIFRGMRRDWTLLSLGVYIFYWWIGLTADESQHPFLPGIAITTLVISAGAWGYFRAAAPLRRVLALVVGLLLMVLSGLITQATWDSRTFVGMPSSAQIVSLVGVIFLICLVLLVLGTGLFALKRRTRNSRLKEN
jgi:hypothetical protein